MKLIPLTKGCFAKVDDEDFELINKHKWQVLSRGKLKYARGWIKDRGRRDNMHRVILNIPNGLYCDHIDGDGLNNQRHNLRICTQQQNIRNSNKKRIWTAASPYIGVSRYKNKWRYSIKNNDKRYYGYFPCQCCAALAYDMKAIEYFGDFAKTNFIHK